MKGKILIVDDSKGWLNYHQTVLKDFYGAEFAVDTANSARSGYDMIYNNLAEPYKLIISDLQMELDFEPKYAGEWFIEQVKKMNQYANVPIIIISATYNIKTIANLLGVGYLPKYTAARDLEAYKATLDGVIHVEN